MYYCTKLNKLMKMGPIDNSGDTMEQIMLETI